MCFCGFPYCRDAPFARALGGIYLDFVLLRLLIPWLGFLRGLGFLLLLWLKSGWWLLSRFFIFNMVDECNIYKNMGLWVKVHEYRNEKSSVTVFSFLKSVRGGFYFFLVRCMEIHGLFFDFSKIANDDFYFFYFLKNRHWRFLLKPHIFVIYPRILYTDI